MPERGSEPARYHFGEAVDLARGFADGWTYDLPMDAVEEWARQLREELNRIFKEEAERGD